MMVGAGDGAWTPWPSPPLRARNGASLWLVAGGWWLVAGGWWLVKMIVIVMVARLVLVLVAVADEFYVATLGLFPSDHT